MITYDEALETLLAAVAPLGSETIAMEDAAGRYLAEPVTAALDAPRQDVSAMDGYAVRQADARTGRWLDVIGEAAAGQPFPGQVLEGQAVRIFTGAHVPDGADCVVIQEEAVRDGDRVQCKESFGPARHIRKRGSDFEKGETLLAAGSRLTPASLVPLAGADRRDVRVCRLPLVSFIATGDELVAPGGAGGEPYAIPDSASGGVAAMAAHYGGSVVGRFRGRDNLPDLEQLAAQAMVLSDLVVVIGGASVGDRDFAKPMFERFGLTLQFSRIAIKPGKPVWFGTARNKFVLGLPGNPGSAMVTARIFLAPLLAAMQGGDGRALAATFPQRLDGDLGPCGTRETFVRAQLFRHGLIPVGNQVSGAQAPLAFSDWLIRRKPGDEELAAGATVQAIPF